MKTTQFKYFCPKGLWTRANQPNFSSLIWEEYQQIVSTQESGTWEAFQKSENRDKNRNSFVPCWDHTRVVLNTDESTASDYIHANYVDGYKKKKKFICTQSPKTNTLDDFWKMVWTENTLIIVNLTSSDSYNYCQYWSPEEDGVLQAGQFIIKTTKVDVYSNCIATDLDLTDRLGTSRKIRHYLYTDWTEDEIPSDVAEFYKFVLRVNQMRTATVRTTLKLNQDRPGPIIVHCDTGIGRSGIYCTVDVALYRMMATGKISLPKIVISMRQQRHSSVVIPEQYFFCYRVLLYFLKAMPAMRRIECCT